MITTEVKKIGRVIPIRLGPDEDLMEEEEHFLTLEVSMAQSIFVTL